MQLATCTIQSGCQKYMITSCSLSPSPAHELPSTSFSSTGSCSYFTENCLGIFNSGGWSQHTTVKALFPLLSVAEQAELWLLCTLRIWLQTGYQEPNNMVPNFNIHLSKIIYDLLEHVCLFFFPFLFLEEEMCHLTSTEGILAFRLSYSCI